MEYLLIAAFLYILVILLSISDEEFVDETAAKRNDHMKIIAHRGASGYAPENTIAAFDRALELKADYLELDVQMSQDGELVVFHDISISRITNRAGKIKTMNLSSLKKLNAGNYLDDSSQNQQIPTLIEILDRYRDKIGFLIEMKDPENYPGIEKKLANLLKERNLHMLKDHSIIVQSFNQQAIKRFNKLIKTVPTGLLLDFHPSELSTEKLTKLATYINYLNPPAFWTDKKLIEQIHQAGMKAFCWTVNDPNLFIKISNMGVDGIITDYPDLPKLISTQAIVPSTKGYLSHREYKNEGNLSDFLSSVIQFANVFMKELQNEV